MLLSNGGAFWHLRISFRLGTVQELIPTEWEHATDTSLPFKLSGHTVSAAGSNLVLIGGVCGTCQFVLLVIASQSRCAFAFLH